MQNKFISYVEAFHYTYGLPVVESPTLAPDDRAELRVVLIAEELDEMIVAIGRKDIVGIADALGDLLYVVVGAALEYGIDLEPVLDEIQRSNMSKLGEDGKPIYREDGKVIKGPNFVEPDIKKALGI